MNKTTENRDTDQIAQITKKANPYQMGIVVVLLLLGIFLIGKAISTTDEGVGPVSDADTPYGTQRDASKAFLLPEGFLPTEDEAGRGNGPIFLIEYSDYECPFCGRFHSTAQSLVDSGEVTWIYRHFPLPTHPTAEYGAVVGECVKDVVGGEAFWKYTDEVFNNQRTLSQPTYRRLAQAQSSTLTAAVLDKCLERNSPQSERVQMQIDDTVILGITGTPGTYLVNPKTREFRRVDGAQPVEAVREVLEALAK